MGSVLTVTFNPALDITTETELVEPTVKLRCGPPQVEAGGGGINVARVLRRLGCDAKAFALLGGVAGEEIFACLQAEGLPVESQRIAGRTRQSLTVGERASGEQYRFVLPGPDVGAGETAAAFRKIESLLERAELVVASGSLPPGMPVDSFACLTRMARSAGKRLALDSSGKALAAALAERPWLVKPNLEEFSEIIGYRPAPGELERLARDFVADGRAENLLLSLGAEGALFVNGSGLWRRHPPPARLLSAVGAGDSMLAGFIAASLGGAGPEAALARAVAAGTAALMTPGTELCRVEDIARLCSEMRGVAN
ncbi:MAG: 1-phosphofructokinase family hexose kinase [Alphaproteobacteria bacterium]|nr:1-phosphofructokinase family hexose kinase [Alphaproteobacteria bacterium]